MSEQTVAIEVRPKDDFLALIERAVENKDISAEKLEKLINLQLKLEDRHAEKLFNAAMIAARKDVQGIGWDRVNPHTKSNYASYPKIDEKLRPVMETHGFAVTFGAEPTDHPNMMIMYADVMHEGGHTRRYPLPMPIDNKGPQGGTGVMTGPQAVGNGTSYGMRYLVKMIFNIPMLVDKDDNDGNPVRTKINEAEQSNLKKMMKGFSEERITWLLGQFNISELSELPRSKYGNAMDRINAAIKKGAERGAGGQTKPESKEHWTKNATVNQDQEATLQTLMDEIGGTCKVDFLTANKINKVAELPAGQYQGAVAALERRRRAM